LIPHPHIEEGLANVLPRDIGRRLALPPPAVVEQRRSCGVYRGCVDYRSLNVSSDDDCRSLWVLIVSNESPHARVMYLYPRGKRLHERRVDLVRIFDELCEHLQGVMRKWLRKIVDRT